MDQIHEMSSGQSMHLRHCKAVGFSKCRMVYCITPALDGYVILPDRTPHTQMMTSLNICGTVLYNTQHPCSHASLFASIPPICLHPPHFLPSELTTHHWLISTKLSWHTHVSWPQPNMQPPIIVENMWNEEESKTNEVLKGDKVPLGDK